MTTKKKMNEVNCLYHEAMTAGNSQLAEYWLDWYCELQYRSELENDGDTDGDVPFEFETVANSTAKWNWSIISR